MSATRASATSLFGSSPASDTPMSATTTLAPSAAAARATARPIPPPAPVMATTLPFKNSLMSHCLSCSFRIVGHVRPSVRAAIAAAKRFGRSGESDRPADGHRRARMSGRQTRQPAGQPRRRGRRNAGAAVPSPVERLTVYENLF